jgi:hypothetical protein
MTGSLATNINDSAETLTNRSSRRKEALNPFHGRTSYASPTLWTNHARNGRAMRFGFSPFTAEFLPRITRISPIQINFKKEYPCHPRNPR